MKNLLVIFLGTMIFYSCHFGDSVTGSGNIKTEKRNVDHFDGVKTTGSIDVEIKNGEPQFVEVEADDNVLQYVIVEVSDEIMNVHYRSNMSFTNVHAKVFVTVSTLNKIIVSGSSNIVSTDTLKNDKEIKINISGSGDINAMVDAPSITANVTGSGNVTLQGRTRNFDCDISGSGDLKCKNLLSEVTDARITGSGNAHVYASVKLKVVATGSGDVYYSGNPTSPEIRKTGSGALEREN